jgi:hypothetical protein
MFMYRERLVAGTFERVRIDLAEEVASEAAAEALARQAPSTLVVQGQDRAELDAFLDAQPYATGDLKVVVEARGAGESAGLFTAPREDVGRVVVRTVEELAPAAQAATDLLAQGGTPAELEVVLGPETLAWLLGESDAYRSLVEAERLVASLPNFEYLSAMRDVGVGPEELAALAELGLRLMNVAPCLGGERTEPAGHVELSRELLDDKGQLSVSPYVQRYITGEYYKKSVRCRGCVLNESCKGMHIQFLRAHGFGSLQPLPGSDVTLSAA